MNGYRRYTVLFLAIIAITALVSLITADDPLTRTRIKYSTLHRLYEKNKPAIVLIRVAIDATQGTTTGDEGVAPKKSNIGAGPKPPLYQEHMSADELGTIQAFQIGTGFFFDSSGEILTSYHVVGSHKSIFVVLHDSTTYMADVVGFNEKIDLALLKIRSTNRVVFPHLALGNSRMTKVADPIVVIGHPEALGWTLSTGFISALRGNDPITPPIQLQSMIKPGSSGSPLINPKDNTVIGIIQSVIDDFSFAIPIQDVKNELKNLRNQKNK